MITAPILMLALIATVFLALVLRNNARVDKRCQGMTLANAIAGQHAGGKLRRTAEVALSSKWLCLKQGTADTEVNLCGATDRPLGFNEDTAALDEELTVNLPGATKRTLKAVVASGVTITINDHLYTAASGTVTNVPVVGCTHLGIALMDAATGTQVEFDPVGFGLPGDAGLKSTVAVANTGTPDGVGHVTGQVQNVFGDTIAGSFEIGFWSAATTLAAPADLGDLAAAANSLLIEEHTTDASGRLRTHTDGSWGLDFNLTSDGNLHVMLGTVAAVATAGAAITGN